MSTILPDQSPEAVAAYLAWILQHDEDPQRWTAIETLAYSEFASAVAERVHPASAGAWTVRDLTGQEHCCSTPVSAALWLDPSLAGGAL